MQAHYTPSTKAHSPSTHSTGTRSRQGLEHAHADGKPHDHTAHSRDIDDVDGRRPHGVDERYASAPHAQHEGAQPEHAQHGHAQQAGARARTPAGARAGTM